MVRKIINCWCTEKLKPSLQNRGLEENSNIINSNSHLVVHYFHVLDNRNGLAQIRGLYVNSVYNGGTP